MGPWVLVECDSKKKVRLIHKKSFYGNRVLSEIL